MAKHKKTAKKEPAARKKSKVVKKAKKAVKPAAKAPRMKAISTPMVASHAQAEPAPVLPEAVPAQEQVQPPPSAASKPA